MKSAAVSKSNAIDTPRSDVRPVPAKTGVCLCGCGQTCSVKSHFAPGHDHRLQGYLVHAAFGGTAGLAVKFAHLIPQGGPPNRRLEQEARRAEREVKRAMVKADSWKVVEPSAPVETVDAKAVKRGGPGSGGMPKVKVKSKSVKLKKKGGK